MLTPKQVYKAGRKAEAKNLEFRRFLKQNAIEEELDEHFKQLHDELFAEYDCKQCRNCCYDYCAVFDEDEVEAAAACLGMEIQEFKDAYLDEVHGRYETRGEPCDFLSDQGDCMLENCKPESCNGFPFTDQPGRIWSLMTVMEYAKVCPVVHEMVERLKVIYGFDQ